MADSDYEYDSYEGYDAGNCYKESNFEGDFSCWLFNFMKYEYCDDVYLSLIVKQC